MWRYEILKWLPGYDIKKIQIFQNENMELDQKYQIIIMTYELAAKLHYKIEDFKIKVCIVDEAQYFRSRDVPHGKVLMNLIGAMKRVILLTGTNLIKKPHEIYCLLRMV
jgi:SNF2 family DNA or RNA helicase